MHDSRARELVAASGPEQGLTGAFPIVELRQYTLHDGMRDRLIDLFERQFIESQEVFDMKVIGTFVDVDRPDRFVWLRGFRDMASRFAGLDAFYYGPVWMEHREDANSTMIDSDNVLLLRTANASPRLSQGTSRPGGRERRDAGLIVATIEYLKPRSTAALAIFETEVEPQLKRSGIFPIAWLATEPSPNNFPRLPVREGEEVLVWFGRFASQADHRDHQQRMDEASKALSSLRERAPEVLRLAPTSRSELR